MCINYQFWNILENLFEPLNESEVSMIIAENSKNINPGKEYKIDLNMHSRRRLRYGFKITSQNFHRYRSLK